MKSIMAVSMHKAGSTIIDNILLDFMQAKGYAIDRISLGVPSSPLPADEVYVSYQDKMLPDGVYYGVARGPYVSRMPVLKTMKIIMQVRDPRDCITSAYFSYKVSHVPPKDPAQLERFLERRRKLGELDIDQYALSQVASYKTRMTILHDLQQANPDLLLVKYEDMVQNTPVWLDRISGFIGQPLTPELRTALGDKIDFSVGSEDIRRHKRQITPGDHKRKLQNDTIEQMTEALNEQLALFGYAP